MRGFFSVEGGLYRFMSRLFDMLKINILWLLTGGPALMLLIQLVMEWFGLTAYEYISFIPLIFIGPATTAVFAVTLRMVDEREGYVARHFIKAYRENFKQGMIMGIIGLVAVYAVWLEFQFYHAAMENGQSGTLLLIIFIAAFFFVFTHLVYAFALQARYENTVINTLRNSFSISLRYFLRTILAFVVLAVIYIIFMWNNITLFFGILVGPACMMLAISGIGIYIFRRIEAANEEDAAVVAQSEGQEAEQAEEK